MSSCQVNETTQKTETKSKFSWWSHWIQKKNKYCRVEQKFADEDLFSYYSVGTGLPPIYQQSTFSFKNVKDGRDRFMGVPFEGESPFARIYTRLGNPTTAYLEKVIFKLECSHIIEKALKENETSPTIGVLVTSSGMAAISTVLMSLLNSGDEIICGTVYGCTNSLLHHWYAKYNIKTHFIDTSDLKLVEKILSERERVRCIFIESPENPTLHLNDIEGLSKLTEKYEIPLVVDSTFASPYLQQPFRLGADIVIHSTTKYLNGHSTSIGGVFLGPWEFMRNEAFIYYKDLGGTPSPMDSFIVSQNVQDLAVRQKKQCKSAYQLALFLESHPLVKRVFYPFLESFPQQELAKRQMRYGGAMISFEVKGGFDSAVKLMDYFARSDTPMELAVSLGCVITYIEHPASMTHSGVPNEEKIEQGITDDLIRMSVGLEGVSILQGGLARGLAISHEQPYVASSFLEEKKKQKAAQDPSKSNKKQKIKIEFEDR